MMRLGQRLIKQGIVEQSHVDIALKEQEECYAPLGKLLIKMGFVDEKTLLPSLAVHLNKPYTDLSKSTKPLPIADIHDMTTFTFYPFKEENGITHVAIDDISDIQRMEKIFDVTGTKRLAFSLCDRQTITAKLSQSNFSHLGKVKQFIVNNNTRPLEQWDTVALLNQIIEEAIDAGASDIHFEPRSYFFNVRYRIDGVLHKKHAFHKKLWRPVLTRLKVVSELDISESRLAQDGQFHYTHQDETVDIRIACQPAIKGEKIVLRLLKKKSIERSLMHLGFDQSLVDILEQHYQQPHGLILFTGPTGSGKTTSLYAVLNELKTKPVNIVTIEDPVEYEVDDITQCSIEYSSKMNFSAHLKSVLRQDPDVILLGEIRDKEVAQSALDASISGHLVLSSLHSDSAENALLRLMNMDIDKSLLASGLKLIVNQRLVRKLCPDCFGETCASCDFTGYQGRTAVVELLVVNAHVIQKLMSLNAATNGNTNRSDQPTLHAHARKKIDEGITDDKECIRVLGKQYVGG